MATERRSINATTAPKGGGSRTAFGTVPGAIGVPPNIYSQTSGLLPNVSGVSDVIGSELSGQVSPATMKALQNAAATFGVTSGMPGVTSGSLAANSLFGNIAGYSEGRQRQGVQDYLSSLTGIGSTMTNPNLAAEIASRNATLAAAPDPEMAAKEQMRQWMEKYNLTSGLGGPSGGTGAWGAGGRPPDAPSYGGGGGKQWWEQGFGAARPESLYNAPQIGGWWGASQETPITQHLSPQVGTYSEGNNLPFAGSGQLGGMQFKSPIGDQFRGVQFKGAAPWQSWGSQSEELKQEFFPDMYDDFWTGNQ